MYRWMNKLARKAINFAIILLMLCAFVSLNSESEYVYSMISAVIIGGLFFSVFLMLFGQKITIRKKELIIQTGIIRRKRRLDNLTMITTLEYVHSKYSIDRRQLLFSFKNARKSIQLRLQPLNEDLLVSTLEEIQSICGEDVPITFIKRSRKNN